MNVEYPRSESDRDHRFLLSFADALKGTFGPEKVR
jgi:hypothetical protein